MLRVIHYGGAEQQTQDRDGFCPVRPSARSLSNEPQDLIDWQSETETERERERGTERERERERERKRGGKREAADDYTLAAAAKATFAEESHVWSRGIRRRTIRH